ncbi:hypothetical protein [Amycolatopsis jiangsuensis]|uniref:Uncharacterized protein n=1 Tax=Amycolatopsis jiangsuensis TaxID=1181879 RepID=A0A840J0P4_9PSEU|nr:hypothetical protein [Amycolatopsis jiangsuensis]MBB4687503.1 hypothetical protein [Amycolatopsis jiangsuensis]
MDEHDVEKLFSGAPGDVPSPTFDVADVVRRSRRETLRRRNRFTAGAAAVLVAAGFGTWGIVGSTGGTSGSPATLNSAGGPAQPSASAARPLGTDSGSVQNFPAQPSRQGDSGDGRTGPRVEGTHGCARVDWELATALAGELPGHLTAKGASPGSVCTTGARGAGFPLADGAISVAVFPAGKPVAVPAQPAGAASLRRTTPGGATLVLVSVPGTTGDPAPYAGDLDRYADGLAARF